MAEQNKELVEVLAQPKTVRMRGKFDMPNGRVANLEGPLECWIAALVYTLTPTEKMVFATQLERMLEMRAHQLGIGKARVVAEIEMPNMARM